MFNSSNEPAERYARAVGRIVFGAVLLVGAGILVQRLLTRPDPAAAKLIAATWIVALFCGWAIRQVTVPFCERGDVRDIFTLSYAVPTAGIALLLPLSLHMIVTVAIGASGFDTWALISLYFAGAAHVAFAIFATLRAVQLAQGRIAISTRAVFTRTLVVACIPFALFVLPPLVVGLTGVAIVPLLDRMEPMIERERGTQAPLPMAVVA